MELLVIAGPTACNKSQIGIELAKQLNGEIVCADSLQVYRHMDIGTAKIKNTMGVLHHLIDIIDPWDFFCVASYQRLAKAAIADIHVRGRLPILVGGSGFYINALLYKIDFDQTSSNIPYRDSLYALASARGGDYIFELLNKVDPEYAAKNRHNTARLIRGLEYYNQTKAPISKYIKMQQTSPQAYNAAVFLMDLPREELYKNINERTDQMIEQGLVQEVEGLLRLGAKPTHAPMGAIGYKEIVAYINGNTTMQQAINDIKQNTRRFAKRQLTWFRNKTNGSWIEPNTSTILEALKKCQKNI